MHKRQDNGKAGLARQERVHENAQQRVVYARCGDLGTARLLLQDSVSKITYPPLINTRNNHKEYLVTRVIVYDPSAE
jgi:hypothetical protein